MPSSLKAKLLIILHAHLPYIRIPDKKFPMQELWLYQALTESYIPLILIFQDLINNNIDFKITISLSPTLLSMLGDNYYKSKYKEYLDTLLNISNENTGNFESISASNGFSKRVKKINTFWNNINGKIINEFRKLSADNRINIITTSATHALLPMYRDRPDFIESQIKTGLRTFKALMDYSPEGFWLPEMAYSANLDKIMNSCRIRYTFLDAHSVYHTAEPAPNGNFFPSISSNNVIIFPRELILSNIIWSASSGYPGDPRYREFHFDYTYSLPESLLAKYNIDKIPFGLKIYSITGGNEPKKFYNASEAAAAVNEHACDYLTKINNRASEIAGHIDRTPVFTLPFDAELFGHWWYEGPEFLKLLMEKISASDDIELMHPMDIYDESLGTIIPGESSWGREGYFKSWISPECSRIYPEIAGLYKRLMNVNSGSHRTAELHALKEIFLASASDWTFLISNNSSKDYAKMRLYDHLNSASLIIESLENGRVNKDFISERQKLYPLFSETLS